MPNITPTLTPVGTINAVRFQTDSSDFQIIAPDPFTATLASTSNNPILFVTINAINGTGWSLGVVDVASGSPCNLIDTHNSTAGTTISDTTDGRIVNVVVNIPAPAPGG